MDKVLIFQEFLSVKQHSWDCSERKYKSCYLSTPIPALSPALVEGLVICVVLSCAIKYSTLLVSKKKKKSSHRELEDLMATSLIKIISHILPSNYVKISTISAKAPRNFKGKRS